MKTVIILSALAGLALCVDAWMRPFGDEPYLAFAGLVLVSVACVRGAIWSIWR